MKKLLAVAGLGLAAVAGAWAQTPDDYPANYAQAPRFKALAYYSADAEPAHVEFAEQAIDYLWHLSWGEGFILDRATSLEGMTADSLSQYSVVVDINALPSSAAERKLFEDYMENGGGWVGFHAAGYNDESTAWPWFNTVLGTGRFFCNTWPPQPALMTVDIAGHDVTRNLPAEFVAPECEWYQWRPSAADNPDVDVLCSLSPKNLPLGIKDVVTGGEFPVVWTNRRYRMIYLNIGHGDREFTDPTQNLLFVNALRWVVSRDPSGNPFEKRGAE